jgi:hypothetical protein
MEEQTVVQLSSYFYFLKSWYPIFTKKSFRKRKYSLGVRTPLFLGRILDLLSH